MGKPSSNSIYGRPRLARLLVGCLLVVVLAVGGYLIFAPKTTKQPDYHYKDEASSNQTKKKPPSQLNCIAKLPMGLKLGQKLMISATANTLSAASRIAARYHLSGVILMDQVPAGVTHNFASKQPLPPLIATDQEGGTVQRYKSEGALPSEQVVASELTPDRAEALARRDDAFLYAQGVNMNLAPVVDVAPDRGNSVLGSRIFSSDPNVVAEFARAYVRAGLDSGVLPTLKHFPGLGSATGDTDAGPATVPAFDELQMRDIVPYKKLAGTTAAVMVGNQTVPGLTDGLPASLSRLAITDDLRKNLGYQNNLVITDSLSAKAITNDYSVASAVIKSWEAGSDVALIVQINPATVISSQQIAQILNLSESAIKNGQLREAEIDASTLRIFQLPQKHIDACHA